MVRLFSLPSLTLKLNPGTQGYNTPTCGNLLSDNSSLRQDGTGQPTNGFTEFKFTCSEETSHVLAQTCEYFKNWPLARVVAEMVGVGPGLTQILVVQTEVQDQQQL